MPARPTFLRLDIVKLSLGRRARAPPGAESPVARSLADGGSGPPAIDRFLFAARQFAVMGRRSWADRWILAERIAWPSRPSLGRSGIKPIDLWPWRLIVLLVGALVIHAIRHPNDRLPAWIHGSIAGKARVIDRDTIVISGSHIHLHGIDAPESDQTCTDAGNGAWPCGQAATRELIALRAAARVRDLGPRPLSRRAHGTDINAWMVQLIFPAARRPTGGRGPGRQTRNLGGQLHATLGVAAPAFIGAAASD